MTRTSDWKEKLIDLIKASGQEVINRADDIVGDGDILMEISIWLRFPIDGVPELEVTRQHAVRESFKVFRGDHS